MEAGTVSKHVALPHQMARPPLGDLALSVDDKKDISPMAAILRSRGHLQHNAAIPGSKCRYALTHPPNNADVFRLTH